MMRSPVLALLALAVACRGSSQAAPPFDGEQALRWVGYQVAAGPRIPGTVPHREIGDWLLSQLRQRADTVEVQAFSHVTQTGDTLPLRNVLARFRPGEGDRVLFLAHWDSKPHAEQDPDPSKRDLPVPGANDGASGVAVLLGVADQLKRTPPSLGVDLLFVDGEDYGRFEGDAPDNLLGSRYFAAHLPAGYHPLYAVLLDMVGDRDQAFPQEGYSVENAPEVVDRVWQTAEDIGLGRVFRPIQGIALTDDHIPLLQAGIHAIDVIDFDYPWWHTTEDTPDKVSARSLANVGKVVLALVR
jgi:glutaminyl-peptide cyclotransferase